MKCMRKLLAVLSIYGGKPQCIWNSLLSAHSPHTHTFSLSSKNSTTECRLNEQPCFPRVALWWKWCSFGALHASIANNSHRKASTHFRAFADAPEQRSLPKAKHYILVSHILIIPVHVWSMLLYHWNLTEGERLYCVFRRHCFILIMKGPCL